VVENLLAVQEDVRVSEDALEPEPDRGAGVVGRERELFSARAENRRKGRLGALRAHTKAPYKMDFRRKTLRALNRPEGPGPVPTLTPGQVRAPAAAAGAEVLVRHRAERAVRHHGVVRCGDLAPAGGIEPCMPTQTRQREPWRQQAGRRGRHCRTWLRFRRLRPWWPALRAPAATTSASARLRPRPADPRAAAVADSGRAARAAHPASERRIFWIWSPLPDIAGQFLAASALARVGRRASRFVRREPAARRPRGVELEGVGRAGRRRGWRARGRKRCLLV
jgi:hypothetical protein